ncbi:response regulator transcription factor [Bacillus sp. ISL-34]|uniref:response regulator n=1 Tax=Bacillus sp. ISL-34 TaxID=2819121 RepID=UPI001BEC1EDF|nr:response regulator transcription factor [Bacillus sp. ISL-34]MBT2649812.1 response regulator transcription factor [Bacillus sp. ISL-34]
MIRIVIAENQQMLLEAISSLLNFEEDIEIVGQAGNGEEAMALVHQLQPDVCIMDMEMPVMSGLEAAEALKSFECKVVILTTFRRTGHFQLALKANVCGYLLKDSPGEELACSIRSIMEGKRIYSPELIDESSSNNVREMGVLGLLADGQSAIEPSNQQSGTIGTVRKYFSTIKDKMKLPAG